MNNNQSTAPQSLTERYRPEECAEFVLMRQMGNVRLWQSTHLRANGQKREEHHVTVGDEAECMHVRDISSALMYFTNAEQQPAMAN